jgi:hypothetical protein
MSSSEAASREFTFEHSKSLFIQNCDTRSLPWNAKEQCTDIKETSTLFAKEFQRQNIGRIKQVHLTKKHSVTGIIYYTAVIYFDEWYSSPEARQLQMTLADPTNKARFYYHEKWYWVLQSNILPPMVIKQVVSY